MFLWQSISSVISDTHGHRSGRDQENLQDIKAIIADKGIDFVSLSRLFIIEPDIVNRFQQGQQSSRCIDCGFCLIGVTEQ